MTVLATPVSSGASLLARRRARREARIAEALARIPADLLARRDWEAVKLRADAFGIVPGQYYGGRRSAQPSSPDGTRAFSYQPFIGEIMVVGFTFAPNDWLDCAGQLLSIAEYDTLFALLGTSFGGDGVNTFALPDLQGRVPVGSGTGPGLSSIPFAQSGGQETVLLTSSEMPAHTHGIATKAAATAITPASGLPGAVDLSLPARYAPTVGTDRMVSPASTGGGLPHSNLPPSLGLRFCISLFGIFPTRS